MLLYDVPVVQTYKRFQIIIHNYCGHLGTGIYLWNELFGFDYLDTDLFY